MAAVDCSRSLGFEGGKVGVGVGVGVGIVAAVDSGRADEIHGVRRRQVGILTIRWEQSRHG